MDWGEASKFIESVSASLLKWRAKRLIEQYDNKTIRCPRIGGNVNFKLCRSENNMLPCRWLVGCWQMYLDINTFLEEHYTKEELDKVFVLPKPKVESLVEMIEQAKKSAG